VRAGDHVAVLDGGNAADIDAHRGVELERAAAGGGLGVAEHDADLLADLVDENERVRDFETVPVSLRSACDMRRACRPMWESPISPSSSALGTSAATESTTSTSMAPERTRASVISSACSPESGCETSRLSTSTPSFLA
jgi:hypothetical protein